jgi:hypothetical protein
MFTIDSDNNITAHSTAEEATSVSGADRFSTTAEFAELAGNWAPERLVEIWNSLTGVTPVKKFKDRSTAVARICKRIEGLEDAKPEPAKKALARAQKPQLAPSKAKATKNASRGKQALKGRKKAATAREGSKKADIVALLEKPKGATLAELMKLTGWQAHSLRGLISGTLGKKMGLTVTSTKREDGERVYSISR